MPLDVLPIPEPKSNRKFIAALAGLLNAAHRGEMTKLEFVAVIDAEEYRAVIE